MRLCADGTDHVKTYDELSLLIPEGLVKLVTSNAVHRVLPFIADLHFPFLGCISLPIFRPFQDNQSPFICRSVSQVGERMGSSSEFEARYMVHICCL
jgi:hypothetical protein